MSVLRHFVLISQLRLRLIKRNTRYMVPDTVAEARVKVPALTLATRHAIPYDIKDN